MGRTWELMSGNKLLLPDYELERVSLASLLLFCPLQNGPDIVGLTG